MNDDEVIEAYNTIREYCEKRDGCATCPFQNGNHYVSCVFEGLHIPECWPDPEDI